MLRSAIGAAGSCAGDQVNIETEFAGDDHLFADRLQGLAQQLFISEWAIRLSGVEQGDALFMGRANQLDHARFVGGRAVGGGHAHAAEAQCGNFQAVAQRAGFHGASPIQKSISG
ncbi:hypothetical protein D3C85_1574210 [compost metagenome]